MELKKFVVPEVTKKFEVPEKGGKLELLTMQRMLKPVDNYEEVGQQSLDMHQKYEAQIPVPDLNIEDIREAIARSMELAPLIVQFELTVKTLSQSKLIYDDLAWRGLLRLYDHVKVAAKHNPEFKTLFDPLFQIMKRNAKTNKSASESEPEPDKP